MTGKTDAQGYDAVPKTGEGNRFLYVMLAMIVFAGIAAVYMFKAMRSSVAEGPDQNKTDIISGTDAETQKKNDWDDIG